MGFARKKSNNLVWGTILRKYREEKDWTTRDLEKRTGFDSGYISRIERDMVNISENTLKTLLEALGVTLVQFAKRVEKESPSDAPPPADRLAM